MIEAVNVSKYYGPRRALTDVSFQIAPGEVVGLLGRNGAGKTTMLKILCGLLLPSSGLVRVFGVDAVGDPRGLRERIGFLPDRPPLYPEMTVAQMLAYAGQLHGVAGNRIGARVTEVLGQTGLADRANDLVETLSHGYRQRLGIAQAIVHEPKLVLLDEPISGLDPAQIISMRGLIRSLKDKHTVLLSSHILSEIEETCDRVILLHDGRVAAQGTEHELRSGAGATVELLVRGVLEAVRNSAAAVVGLRDVETQPAPGGLVRLRARVDNDQAREALVGALVHAGLGVRSVADVGGSLEALFMSVTERPMQSGGVA